LAKQSRPGLSDCESFANSIIFLEAMGRIAGRVTFSLCTTVTTLACRLRALCVSLLSVQFRLFSIRVRTVLGTGFSVGSFEGLTSRFRLISLGIPDSVLRAGFFIFIGGGGDLKSDSEEGESLYSDESESSSLATLGIHKALPRVLGDWNFSASWP